MHDYVASIRRRLVSRAKKRGGLCATNVMKRCRMSFCSDRNGPEYAASALAPDSASRDAHIHPRAYGSFARVLAYYVREQKLLTIQDAIHRMSSLPAQNLNLRHRGALKVGYHADIIIFDPDRIQDHATYEKPHQLATGMVHVFVNGVQVLRNGEHTGKLPGRVVRGPGWTGWLENQTSAALSRERALPR